MRTRRRNPLSTAILFIFALLCLLLMTFLLYVRVEQDLKIKAGIIENRRDVYQNRVEVAEIRTLFVPNDYHVAMVPILVPGKAVYGPKPKRSLKMLKKGGIYE